MDRTTYTGTFRAIPLTDGGRTVTVTRTVTIPKDQDQGEMHDLLVGQLRTDIMNSGSEQLRTGHGLNVLGTGKRYEFNVEVVGDAIEISETFNGEYEDLLIAGIGYDGDY